MTRCFGLLCLVVILGASVGCGNGSPAGQTIFASSLGMFPAGAGPIVVPIDTRTNTAGAAISLPATPNSLLVNHSGATVYLGSFSGLMQIDTASRQATLASAAAKGWLRAVSPDDKKVIVSDGPVTHIFDAASSSVVDLNVLTYDAAFSSDGSKLYIAGGTQNFVYSFAVANLQAMPGSGFLVRVSSSGNLLFFGVDEQTIEVRAACDFSLLDSITNVHPFFLAEAPGSKLVVLAGSAVSEISLTLGSTAACPTTVTHSTNSTILGHFVFYPTALLVKPDGSKAYITGVPDLSPPLFTFATYRLDDGTTTISALGSDSGSLSAVMARGGKSVYVGTFDALRRIDTASDSEVKAIPLPFAPHLLGITP